MEIENYSTLARHHTAEMEELSSSLNDFMRKMKDIKTGGAHIQTAGFNKSAAIMEKEVENLRHLYDQKIAALQSQLHELTSKVRECKFDESVLSRSIGDLKQQIESQVARNTALSRDMYALEGAIEKKEEEILENKLILERQQSEEGRCTSASQLKRALRESEEMKQRLQEVCSQNKEYNRQIDQLVHRLESRQGVDEEEGPPVQEQLTAASDKIIHLEDKLTTLQGSENKQALQTLASVTECYNRQLRDYKLTTETAANEKLSVLKSAIERDRSLFEEARSENTKLTTCVEELNTQIRKIQGELIQAEQGKCAAEENLVIEKDRVARQMQEIECKLEDCQQNLFDKMEELKNAKAKRCNDSGISGKAELERGEEASSEIPDSQRRVYEEDVRSESCLPNTYTQPRDTNKQPELFTSLKPVGKYPAYSPPEMPGPPTGYASSLRSGGYSRVSHRPQSAPATSCSRTLFSKQCRMTSQELGRGRSYFNELFCQKPNYDMVCSTAQNRDLIRSFGNSTAKSSLGSLAIYEVSPDGTYIMLYNSSGSTDIEIGKYSIRQNVSGIPVTQFTFPDRMTFRAGSFITVFSGVCSPELHHPPHQFVREGKEKWGTGIGCTTVLCNPKGKAVAWINAPHKHSTGHHTYENDSPNSSVINATVLPNSKGPNTCQRVSSDVQVIHDPPLYLKRLRNCIAHNDLDSGEHRERLPPIYQTYRNGCQPFDQKLAMARRSSSCSSNMSAVSGERRLHSASGLRMGSAPMRKYTPTLS